MTHAATCDRMPHGIAVDSQDSNIPVVDGQTIWIINIAAGIAIAYDAATRKRNESRDFTLPDCSCHHAA